MLVRVTYRLINAVGVGIALYGIALCGIAPAGNIGGVYAGIVCGTTAGNGSAGKGKGYGFNCGRGQGKNYTGRPWLAHQTHTVCAYIPCAGTGHAGHASGGLNRITHSGIQQVKPQHTNRGLNHGTTHARHTRYVQARYAIQILLGAQCTLQPHTLRNSNVCAVRHGIVPGRPSQCKQVGGMAAGYGLGSGVWAYTPCSSAKPTGGQNGGLNRITHTGNGYKATGHGIVKGYAYGIVWLVWYAQYRIAHSGITGLTHNGLNHCIKVYKMATRTKKASNKGNKASNKASKGKAKASKGKAKGTRNGKQTIAAYVASIHAQHGNKGRRHLANMVAKRFAPISWALANRNVRLALRKLAANGAKINPKAHKLAKAS